MTDSSIPDVPAFADALSPLERAALGLQDELSVFEIGLATYPKKEAYQDRKRLTDFLIDAIKAGRLAAYGDPDGWYARVSRPNQRPLSERIRNRDSIINRPPIAKGEQWERCNPHDGTRNVRGVWTGFHAIFDDTDFDGDNCLVGRADYLAFLATPAARGIPKPDGWKAPQGERAAQPETNVAAPVVPLPLVERAKRGLLVDEPKILLHEIAELEYPNLNDEIKREGWEQLLHGLVVHNVLHGCSMRTLPKSQYRVCPVKKRFSITAWSIPREPYRAWRATQPNPPAGSIIHLWLGAAPASSVHTLPQSEPDKPGSGAAESRKRKRVDALGEAIEAALEALSPDGRLPTSAALFEYLLTQDTTRVVIPGDSKMVFYWIASNGNKQSADISTITKRLERMKQGD